MFLSFCNSCLQSSVAVGSHLNTTAYRQAVRLHQVSGHISQSTDAHQDRNGTWNGGKKREQRRASPAIGRVRRFSLTSFSKSGTIFQSPSCPFCTNRLPGCSCSATALAPDCPLPSPTAPLAPLGRPGRRFEDCTAAPWNEVHGPLHHSSSFLTTTSQNTPNTGLPALPACLALAWIGLVSNSRKKSSQPPQHNTPTPSPISVFLGGIGWILPQHHHNHHSLQAPLPVISSRPVPLVAHHCVTAFAGQRSQQPRPALLLPRRCPVAGLTSGSPPVHLTSPLHPILHLPLQCTSTLEFTSSFGSLPGSLLPEFPSLGDSSFQAGSRSWNQSRRNQFASAETAVSEASKHSAVHVRLLHSRQRSASFFPPGCPGRKFIPCHMPDSEPGLAVQCS